MQSSRRFVLALCMLAAAAAVHVPRAAAAAGPPLTVFAASSLKESMDEAAAAYGHGTGQRVRVSYAASSALARQVAQGAPADVFVSADVEWMDELQGRGLVVAATRGELLGNALVLIAPMSSGAGPVALRHGTDLRPLLGARGRIALGMTESVP